MPQKLRLLEWIMIGWIAIVAGCNTSPQLDRISELKTQYEQMDQATQDEVAKGSIAIGHTPEMVYIALGRPDVIETSPDGQDITWTYRNFYPSAKAVKEPLYQAPDLNPLRETMEAWKVNVQKHNELDNPTRPKRADETWDDYVSQNPTDSKLRNALVERSSEVNDEARRPDLDSPDRGSVKLEVMFHQLRVVDAIINETFPAFSVPQ